MAQNQSCCVHQQVGQVGGFELRDVQWPANFETIACNPDPVLSMTFVQYKGAERASASYDYGSARTTYRPLGPVVLVPGGVKMHAVAPNGKTVTGQLLMARYDREAFESIMPIHHWNSDALMRCHDIASPNLCQLMRAMAGELASPDSTSARAISSLSELILIELARALRSCLKHSTSASSLNAWQLRKIEECLRDTQGHWPNNAELAALCGISAGHLSRGFRATTGMMLSDFANNIRMSRAKALLAADEPPLKQISARLGFSTPSSFTFAFRVQFGETPNAFRQRAHGSTSGASNPPIGRQRPTRQRHFAPAPLA